MTHPNQKGLIAKIMGGWEFVRMVGLGLYPIAALEKQLLKCLGIWRKVVELDYETTTRPDPRSSSTTAAGTRAGTQATSAWPTTRTAPRASAWRSTRRGSRQPPAVESFHATLCILYRESLTKYRGSCENDFTTGG